jgi:5S rRNA maturation endonuclease (ribonuclease M5)
MEELRQEIIRVLAANKPCSVRQCYYLLVSRGAIEKTEREYRGLVRLLSIMRKEGEVPYGWLADGTRWMRKAPSYSSLAEMLSRSQKLYRRAMWDEQPVYLECWVEKESIAGTIFPITDMFDVPLMVCRGYASLSFLHSAAEVIKAENKPTHIIFLSDFDPSGCDISRVTEATLRELAPGIELDFRRIAVTPEQIEKWGLQTRPTKKSDVRAKKFGDRSVELEAVPPETLRDLVRKQILLHIDPYQWQQSLAIERQEREVLGRILSNLGSDYGRDATR